MAVVAQVNPLSQAVGIAKALGDETRLRIVALLKGRELCACQIVGVFDLSNSTISRHLSVLKQIGLLTSRKSGRWVFYTWAADEKGNLNHTQDWLSKMIDNDLQVQNDSKRIEEILKIDPEELCRMQNGTICY